MKSLALFALGSIASAAMAVTPVAPEIVINGDSTQLASLTLTAVSNTAHANNTAQQNLASNAGNVTIRNGGSSWQVVDSLASVVTNEARGRDAYASQNLSSNMGDVTIGGNSTQITTLRVASVANLADGRNSKAVQNIASNNACVTCQTVRRTNDSDN